MHTRDMDDELLTYTQAAETLAVSISTLRRMVDRGDIESVRLPVGGPRIRRSEVDRLIKSSIATTQEEGPQ